MAVPRAAAAAGHALLMEALSRNQRKVWRGVYSRGRAHEQRAVLDVQFGARRLLGGLTEKTFGAAHG